MKCGSIVQKAAYRSAPLCLSLYPLISSVVPLIPAHIVIVIVIVIVSSYSSSLCFTLLYVSVVQDVIWNDNIKLDEMFKFSLSTDIFKVRGEFFEILDIYSINIV